MDSKRLWRKRSYSSTFNSSLTNGGAPPQSMLDTALTPRTRSNSGVQWVISGEALEALKTYFSLCAMKSLQGGGTSCTPRQLRYFQDEPGVLQNLEGLLLGGASGNRARRLFDALGADGGDSDLVTWPQVLRLLGSSQSVSLTQSGLQVVNAKRYKVEAVNRSERRKMESTWSGLKHIFERRKSTFTNVMRRLKSAEGDGDSLAEYRRHLEQTSPREYRSASTALTTTAASTTSVAPLPRSAFSTINRLPESTAPQLSSSFSSGYAATPSPADQNLFAGPVFGTPSPTAWPSSTAARLTPVSEKAAASRTPAAMTVDSASSGSAAWDTRDEMTRRVERMREDHEREKAAAEAKVKAEAEAEAKAAAEAKAKAEAEAEAARLEAVRAKVEALETLMCAALEKGTVEVLSEAIDAAGRVLECATEEENDLDEDQDEAAKMTEAEDLDMDAQQREGLQELFAQCCQALHEAEEAVNASEEEMDEDEDDGDIYESLVERLTPEQRAEVRQIWRQPGGDENFDVVVELPGGAGESKVQVLGKHMHRMNPGQWLYDEVINMYMWLLQMRDNERVHLFNKSRAEGAEPKKPSHFFNSFFYEKLFGFSGKTATYKNVKRFAKKVKSTGGNLFKLDKIIIPINLGDSHWVLIVAFVQQRRIQYYDSCHGPGDDYLKGLKVYLQNEAIKWKGDESVPQHLLDLEAWDLVPTDRAATPQQNNGSDCGAFACTIANYTSQNLELRFDCENMVHFRERITYDLVHAMEEIAQFESAAGLMERWLENES
jgi:hypothetical protein